MSVSGKYLTMEVNGQEVAMLASWEVDDSGTDKLDATTGSSGGATDTDTGCYDAEIRLSFLIDVAAGTGPPLVTGDEPENVALYLVQGDAVPAYFFPLAKVTGKNRKAEVRGRAECSVTMKNKGMWEEN